MRAIRSHAPLRRESPCAGPCCPGAGRGWGLAVNVTSGASGGANKTKMKNRSRLTISCGFVFVCPGQDSNLHERNCSLPPQSSVSTNFTTWALLSRINFRECKYRHYFAIRKIFAEKTTKFAWGPPGSFCGGPGMLYLSVISLSR